MASTTTRRVRLLDIRRILRPEYRTQGSRDDDGAEFGYAVGHTQTIRNTTAYSPSTTSRKAAELRRSRRHRRFGPRFFCVCRSTSGLFDSRRARELVKG